jgi:isopentenyldiphosphate isomerase
MINKDELVFAVDENNNPIEPVARKAAHREGIYHRVADIVVMNSKNDVLCSKRSMLKDNNPGKWDFPFGGHAGPGVEMIQCAMDELREESGLVAKPEDLVFWEIYNEHKPEKKHFHFVYVYTYKWDGEISELTLEEEEVSEVKWVPLKELIEDYMVSKKHEWSDIPYAEKFFKYLTK